MEMNIPCPACGALLTLPSNATRATCPYCGNQFLVDMSSVEPGMKIVPREEMQSEPLPVQSALTESAQPDLPPPPQPTLYAEPPIPEPVPANNFSPAPPVRRSNATAIIVAVAVVLLVCALFACIFAAAVIANIRIQ